jgi:hypothetical protein
MSDDNWGRMMIVDRTKFGLLLVLTIVLTFAGPMAVQSGALAEAYRRENYQLRNLNHLELPYVASFAKPLNGELHYDGHSSC